MFEIKGYKLLEELYNSSNSLIYRAKNIDNHSNVILKILRVNFPSVKEINNYKQEFEITTSNLNEGIIKAYEMMKYDDKYIIIFEDIGAISLNKIIQKKAFDLKEFFPIAIQITDFLWNIHKNNIIHKDINPSNIILNPETKQLKIIDFGISTKLSQENLFYDNINLLEGTIAYISPEQTGRMNRNLDYRTDFYSLGLTFYELLTGNKLFFSSDPLELIHFHLALEPIFTSDARSYIPQNLENIILKLISKNPEDRYQSAWGLKKDLEKCYEFFLEKKEDIGFKLGQNDIPYKFCISQKLYGREEQLNILLENFEKIKKGNTEFTLVSGYSGIGKSTLIQKIQKPILKSNSYFCKGKFEQFNRHIPYSAISQACSSLIKQILSQNNISLENWKNELIETLGTNAKIIIDIVPELETIIGKKNKVTELNSTESKNRFHLTFSNFIKIFAKENSPVVFFLDDLQWADVASLNLLENILLSKDINYLFFLGAYRDNEVDNKHNLTIALENIKKYVNITNINLDPLSKLHVNQLISDTLSVENTDITLPLTEIIYNKTEGNPFFINELLKNLYENKIFNFNFKNHKWEWDKEKINNLDVSDNVINLILNKLKECSEDAVELLKITSCIGNNFTLNNLIILMEKPLYQIIDALKEVIEIGAITSQNNNYKALKFISNENTNSWLLNSEYKYTHDKVQQAAYFLKSKQTQEYIHLSIGRLMLNKLSEEEIEFKIIEIVQQLNKGKSLVIESDEKLKLASLNLRAGKKAKLSAAYKPALEFLLEGKSVLPEISWESNYELTFELFKSISECAYICGEFELAEENSHLLIDKSKSDLEKAEIYYIQGIQYTTILKLHEAIDVIKKGLSLLGLNLLDDYEPVQIFEEAGFVAQNLGSRDILKLINEPEIIDNKNKLIAKLLQGILLPTYTLCYKNFMAFCILKAVNHCLKYGNVPETAYIFNAYTLLLGHIFGDLKTAFKFGELSMLLNERFKDPKYSAVNLFTNIVFAQYWNKPSKEYVESYRKVIEVGLETGELINTTYACTNITQWDTSLDLNKAIEQGEKYFKIIKSIRFESSIYIGYIFQNLRLNFIGKTNNLFSLSNNDFDEEKVVLSLIETKNFLVLALYYIYKIQPCFHYDNYQLALKYTKEAEKFVDFLSGQAHIVDFTLFSFLTYTNLYPQMNEDDKLATKELLEKKISQMNIWAENMPTNFDHLKYLMDAEMARLENNILEADNLYQKSINLSEKYSFMQHHALANELAGKLWLNIGKDEFAKVYLKKAHYLYGIWGAIQKVKQLDEKYQFITLSKSLKLETTITSNSSSNLIDIETIIKSSQTLLNEKNLALLLEKMIKLIIENAGADKGILILPQKDEWFVEAEYNINSKYLNILQSIPIEKYTDSIPSSIIYYAIHTRENIVCNNVQTEEKFINDSYILKNEPLSILCIPLINQANVQGILYLENNLTTNAFTEKHLEILSLLSIQAAISIENTILYQELEQRVKERTNELLKANYNLESLNNEKTEFLNLVTHNLKSPLASVIGFSSLINQANDLNKEEIKIYSSQIISSSNKMLNMIENLLDISSIEDGNYNFKLENIFLIPFIEDLLMNYTEQLNIKKLTINFIYSNKNIQIHADEAWLAQIMDNLLSNAIKFSLQEKEITIKIDKIKDKIKINVIDQGPGINEKDQKRLFQKFARLSALPTYGESSSGLGLYITKKMVEIMDGKIYCESNFGSGSNFIIEF
ncbi:MAG: ATP-binding sensor histidine kinase [Cyanobacteriota bacterium]